MHDSPFCLGTLSQLVGLVGWDRTETLPLKDQRTFSTDSLNRWQHLRVPFQGVKELSLRGKPLIISCYRWRRLGRPKAVISCTEHAHFLGDLQTHCGSLIIGSLTQDTQADLMSALSNELPQGCGPTARCLWTWIAREATTCNSAHSSKSQMKPENPNGVKPPRKHEVEYVTEQKNQPKSHGHWHKREGTKPNLHP